MIYPPSNPILIIKARILCAAEEDAESREQPVQVPQARTLRGLGFRLCHVLAFKVE